jgi:hypothetical protein
MPITKTSYPFPKNVLVYCIIDKRSLSTWNGIARKRRRWTSISHDFQIAAGAQTASPGVCPGVFLCGRLPFLDSRVLIASLWMRGFAKTNTFTTWPCSYHQTSPAKICQEQGNVSLSIDLTGVYTVTLTSIVRGMHYLNLDLPLARRSYHIFIHDFIGTA